MTIGDFFFLVSSLGVRRKFNFVSVNKIVSHCKKKKAEYDQEEKRNNWNHG